jgi:hypothetical protein
MTCGGPWEEFKPVKKRTYKFYGHEDFWCFIGFHKWKTKKDRVYKSGNVETNNYVEYCKKCGKIKDEWGSTNFSMKFIIKSN